MEQPPVCVPLLKQINSGYFLNRLIMKVINCTPHAINVAGTSYPASGHVARVNVTFTSITTEDGIPVTNAEYGSIEGLPDCGDFLIVSAMVLAAAAESKHSMRYRMLAPATGHPDVVRNDRGHILSVPAFVTL